MGIRLIMALNIIRVTIIVVVGYNFGPEHSINAFSRCWRNRLMFIGVLLLLTITDKAFKKTKPTPRCSICNTSQTKPTEPFCSSCGKLFKAQQIKIDRTDIEKITGVILITIMLLFIQAPVFALTQGPAAVMTQ